MAGTNLRVLKYLGFRRGTNKNSSDLGCVGRIPNLRTSVPGKTKNVSMTACIAGQGSPFVTCTVCTTLHRNLSAAVSTPQQKVTGFTRMH